MPDIRPAASLTSGLLARRGDARPAMRHQPIANLHLPTEPHDDLGWNDTGEDQHYQPPVTSLTGLTPLGGVPAYDEPEEHFEEPLAPEAPEPTISPLTHHLESISQRLAQPTPREVSNFKPMIERKPAKVAKVEPAAHRKAAFTLRIDGERHLRLRLLSALVNRSSQQLLIEALDALLAAHDTVEDLAGHVEESSAAARSSNGF